MHVQTIRTRLLLTAAAAGLALAASPGTRAGTQTANLQVNATVSANCIISTTTVDFGSYDPIVANATAPDDSTGTVVVTCTTGDATTITLGQGLNADSGSTDAAPLRRMKDSGTDYLSYNLYQDDAYTTVWGNTDGTGKADTGDGLAQTLTVYGQVAATQNVPVGSYTDTVVATVTF